MLQVSVPIAHELLAQYIDGGQALVQRASLVGDFSDYESWKGARRQWIDPTVEALEHVYGGAKEAEEFKAAVTPSDGGQRWQQQYAVDVDCVKEAIDLLKVLQGELAFSQPASGLTGAPELAAGGEAGDELREQSGSELREQSGSELREQSGSEPDEALDGAREASRRAEPAPQPLAAERQPADRPPRLEDAPAEEPSEVRTREPAPEPAPAEQSSFGSELAPAPIVGSELAQHTNSSVSPAGSLGGAPAGTKQVFLAHGRNEKWRQAVTQLLEHAGPHEITILNERQDQRGTLVEQVGTYAPGSRYAVVLLTADDIGAPRLESVEEPYFSPRAPQGVVFEMGFLVAALTPGCVCVLYEDGVELPCDLDGIAYVRLDLAGTWQPKLLLHLRKAGFDYDLNKLVAV